MRGIVPSDDARALVEKCTLKEPYDKYHITYTDIHNWFNISFDTSRRTHNTASSRHYLRPLPQTTWKRILKRRIDEPTLLSESSTPCRPSCRGKLPALWFSRRSWQAIGFLARTNQNLHQFSFRPVATESTTSSKDRN
jgi:hypothetical protein